MNCCDFPSCGASFNKPWRLTEHYCSAHTGERPHICSHPGCDKAFIRAYHLKRHMLTHSNSKPEHRCPHSGCERVYSSLQSLHKHTKVHSDPSPHKCDYCDASFKKHTQLAVHRAEHTGTLPFLCQSEGCSAAFNSPSGLKRHQKTHKGFGITLNVRGGEAAICNSSPLKRMADNVDCLVCLHAICYRCPVKECGAVFAKWTELRKHASTHPKVCEVCQATFSRKRQLKLHMATHSASRQVFACPEDDCKRFYTTPYNLQQHITSFHKRERPFKCDQADCSASFSTKQSLQRHIHNLHCADLKKRSKLKRKRAKRTLISQISGHIVRERDGGVEMASERDEEVNDGVAGDE